MSEQKCTIYLKADQNIEVTNPKVMIGDVCKIECVDPNILATIQATPLFIFDTKNEKKKNRTVVSILKVIAKIHKIYPSVEIQNMGETDFIVKYEDQKTPAVWIHYIKIVFVVIITFCGSAFSIMAFNNDISTTKLFSQIYEGVTGTPTDGYTILELTYCIGLIIGILVFFNHFGKKKFTVDPTPMEVEMRLYENDIQTTLIQTYSRKEKELDVGTDHISGIRG